MIFWLTFLTKIEIGANWTLKSYASNRFYATNRAAKSVMYLFCLKIVLFLQEFRNQNGELLSAKEFDLFLHELDYLAKTFHSK